MTREERHAQLVAEIHRVSEESGIPVASLYRDRFRELSPIGKSKYVQMSGAWTRAKREALGLEPDSALETMPLQAVPDEGFSVKTISTGVNSEGEVTGQWVKASRRNEHPAVELVPDGMALKGVSTYTGADGSVIGQWTLARAANETREEILLRLLEHLPARILVREGSIPSPGVTNADDILAVYPLGDPHLGMLAWAQETGDRDYDVDIASHLLRGAIDELTTNTPPAARALVVNLGDFFHADNDEHRTKRGGVILDVDSRWAKVLGVGLDTMTHLIDRCLATHNEVRVINEIGNHDDHSAIMLSVALDRHYSREPRVEVDLSPARYHYHRFGANLIGVTHGHGAKEKELESVMAHDCRDLWSETVYRYWYCGHIHHTRKVETRNCIVESFRTLAPKDAWHAGAGYRSGRDMNRIALHREFGEIARSTVSAAYLERMLKGACNPRG